MAVAQKLDLYKLHKSEYVTPKKPVFIDKPVAGSMRDVLTIYQLAKANKVPVIRSARGVARKIG